MERRHCKYITHHFARANEPEKATKEHNGLFHQWGNEMVIDGENSFANTYGIVENEDNGQVVKVAPNDIRFKTQAEILSDREAKLIAEYQNSRSDV